MGLPGSGGWDRPSHSSASQKLAVIGCRGGRVMFGLFLHKCVCAAPIISIKAQTARFNIPTSYPPLEISPLLSGRFRPRGGGRRGAP